MSTGSVSEKVEEKPKPHSVPAERPWEEGKYLYEVSLRANPTRKVRANDRDGARGNYMKMLGIIAAEHEIKVEGPIDEPKEGEVGAEAKTPANDPPKPVDNALLSNQPRKK